MKEPGPFTVFAPTNSAFGALPEGFLNQLFANQTALTVVLTYHVISGEFLIFELVEQGTFTTLQGGYLIITNEHELKVDDANIIHTDIECSNG